MNHPDDSSKHTFAAENEIRSLIPYRDSQSSVTTYSEADSDEETTRGARDYWLMIRNRIWLIVAITLLTTALALFYVARQPNVYEAEARIQVDKENNPAVGANKNGSVIINQPGDDPAYFNTQLLLLTSPAFLRRVVKTLNAEQSTGAFSWASETRTNAWHNIQVMAGIDKDPPQRDVAKGKSVRVTTIAPASPDGDVAEAEKLEPYVNYLRNGLDVKLRETSRLIGISYTNTDPIAAAKVVNAVADTFVQSNWEGRANSTSTASEFLQKRIAELQFKIGDNERRLIDYARDHKIFTLDSGRDMDVDRLAALDKGLLEAENLRKVAEAEFQAALTPGAAAAIVEGSGNSQIAALDARLDDLRQRRSLLLVETGENWPEVKDLNNQIAGLEEQLKQDRQHAVTVVLTNLETRYRQSLAREQALRKAFETQHSNAMVQNAAAIDYRMIQQETTTYRGLLDGLLQRAKENEVILAGTPNNVHVTDYATLPIMSVGPKRLRLIATAFFGSLALAIGFVIFLGSLDESVTVDSAERVERLFGLPALAVIPLAPKRRLSILSMWLKRGSKNGGGLVLQDEKRSAVTESFKKLRTSVQLSNGNGNQTSKTFLITSSLPGEGKTTAVVNTGLVTSQTGAKVLLIDADLRHPTLHEVLGLSNERGLSTILSEDCTEAEVLSMIEQHNSGNLYVLTSGPIPENPAELVGSKRMKNLLHTLGNTFTYIIIDSPPISFFTDAVVLGSIVDGVLMVVRGPRSPRPVARYSIQSLDAVGAPILGVVLNAVSVRMKAYSYYHNYYR